MQKNYQTINETITYTIINKKAEQAKTDIQQKLSRTHYIDSDTYPLGNWLDDWLNNVMQGHVRQNTWESYEIIVRVHLKPSRGMISLAKLQPQAIRAFYDEKKATGLSDRSVQYMHTVLNAALKQAVLDEIIEKNPCTVASVRIKKPQRTKEINVLSQEQVNKLLVAATDWRKLIFFIAWGTGLRREELLGLRWQYIDFKQGTLSVNTTIICTKAFGSMINKPKNASSEPFRYQKRFYKICKNIGSL